MAILQHHFSELIPEVGCDEAGRGCLAGPVFAAAVILPKNFAHHLLNDSKKTNEKTRLILKKHIEENALDWAVASVSPKDIDRINILNASIEAMHKAINTLKTKPKYILVDGNRFKQYKDIPFSTIVKGDGKFMSIAAASILAKTHRDLYMQEMHLKYPHYMWHINKGYPTQAHKHAISKFGISPIHRKSFRLNEQIKIKF